MENTMQKYNKTDLLIHVNQIFFLHVLEFDNSLHRITLNLKGITCLISYNTFSRSDDSNLGICNSSIAARNLVTFSEPDTDEWSKSPT